MANTLILIGASTGGPGHIHKILQKLPEYFPASVIIAQHIGLPFVPSFIKHLSTLTPHPIFNVKDTMSIEPSAVYVCSGECHLSDRNGQLYIESRENPNSLFTPDINTLFLSAAMLPKSLRRMGVILTGIGDDGTNGAQKLHESGGYCLFESEESSIVYGMPRSAAERVPEAEIGTLESIVEKIISFGVSDARVV